MLRRVAPRNDGGEDLLRRVERFKSGAPLNTPDKATFYGGGARGYTDYPPLGEKLAAAQ